MSFCLSVKGKLTFWVKQNRFSLSAFFSSSIAKKQAHFPWVYGKENKMNIHKWNKHLLRFCLITVSLWVFRFFKVKIQTMCKSEPGRDKDQCDYQARAINHTLHYLRLFYRILACSTAGLFGNEGEQSIPYSSWSFWTPHVEWRVCEYCSPLFLVRSCPSPSATSLIWVEGWTGRRWYVTLKARCSKSIYSQASYCNIKSYCTIESIEHN